MKKFIAVSTAALAGALLLAGCSKHDDAGNTVVLNELTDEAHNEAVIVNDSDAAPLTNSDTADFNVIDTAPGGNAG